MSREILLHLLDAKFADPMALIETTGPQRAAGSSYSRRYSLNWDPPPDTLFMRATNFDLSVFGEELPSGSLQMIEARHVRPGLEAALEVDVASTIKALVDYAGHAVTPDEVATVLSTGVWQRERTKQRGAILQAAGFARCLLDAVRLADSDKRVVVWEYTGGALSYAYP